jgi:hypothetical protein
MEYTNWPAGNEHPDAHDYNQLASIYSHAHAASNLPEAVQNEQAIGNSRADWGRQIGHHTFVRDLGGGRKVITDVLFAGQTHKH